VPVKPGDFFDIAPGVLHALGPGLVIYEPQRVLAGRSGVTWRLWDWNRRYAADGVTESREGKARESHIAEGLSVCSPEHQTGNMLEQQARLLGSEVSPKPGVSLRSWVPNQFYSVHQLKLAVGSQVQINLSGSYASALQLRGEVQSRGANGETKWTAGETLLLCNEALPLRLTCLNASAEILLTCPVGTDLSI
jgi:mannose-6-phosphate isomerase class I